MFSLSFFRSLSLSVPLCLLPSSSLCHLSALRNSVVSICLFSALSHTLYIYISLSLSLSCFALSVLSPPSALFASPSCLRSLSLSLFFSFFCWGGGGSLILFCVSFSFFLFSLSVSLAKPQSNLRHPTQEKQTHGPRHSLFPRQTPRVEKKNREQRTLYLQNPQSTASQKELASSVLANSMVRLPRNDFCIDFSRLIGKRGSSFLGTAPSGHFWGVDVSSTIFF